MSDLEARIAALEKEIAELKGQVSGRLIQKESLEKITEIVINQLKNEANLY
jgi:uncharacterized small protein (DUF1192 family)